VDSRGDIVAGDIIVAVAGRPVDSVAALLAVLDGQRIGERVILRVWRDGGELDVPVVLQAEG
jgi:S1-C subfamily serine protease